MTIPCSRNINDTLIRAGKTAGQTFVALIAAQGIGNLDVSDAEQAGLSAAAAGVSVLWNAVLAAVPCIKARFAAFVASRAG